MSASSGAVSVLYGRAAEAPVGPGYIDALGEAASWERLSSVVSIVCALLAVLVVREIRTRVLSPAGA